jgi:hypothetical protein
MNLKFLVVLSVICLVYGDSSSYEGNGQDTIEFDKQENTDLNSIDTSSWDKKSSKKGKASMKLL